MLFTLPPIHPDEDFRSIFFRYHIRTPNQSYIKSREEIFNQKIAKPILYPRNLSKLQSALGLPEQFTTTIIQNHTFYPLFRPFMSLQEHHTNLESMLSGSNNQMLLLKSIQTWHPLLKTVVHFCPACIEDDINQYGECFIHRVHQFYRVEYCPIHGDLLLSHCQECGIPLSNETRSHYLINPECPNGHAIVRHVVMENGCEIISNYITDLYGIMGAQEWSLDELYIKLISHIGYRGYIHFKGKHIFKKDLLTKLIKHYGVGHFNKLEVDVEKLTAEKVMVVFLQKQHMRRNILIYLLLMRYLSGSVANFLSHSPPEYSLAVPFGNGPWMCVNNICPNYRKRVISNCDRKSHEWITGIFTCPHCGLIYTRKGYPKEENEEQYSIDTRGELFQSEALRYYNEGLNIEEISQRLQSNKTSVSKYLRPYRSSTRSNARQFNKETVKLEMEIGPKQASAILRPKEDYCKETICEAIQILGSQASRKQIRKYNIHRYDWLMKHHREWMEQKLPPRNPLPKELNIDKLDEEMFVLASQVVKDVYQNPPPVRITRSIFYKLLPSYFPSRMLNFKESLPRTTQLIDESVETLDQFLYRLFPKVIEWFEMSRYKQCSLRLIQSKFHGYKKGSEQLLKWVENQTLQMNKHARSL